MRRRADQLSRCVGIQVNVVLAPHLMTGLVESRRNGQLELVLRTSCLPVWLLATMRCAAQEPCCIDSFANPTKGLRPGSGDPTPSACRCGCP